MRCSEIEFPLCLGRDFCGTIVDVGQEVNRKICPGQNVWGVVPVHLQGCHAEYVLVPDNCVSLYFIFISHFSIQTFYFKMKLIRFLF